MAAAFLLRCAFCNSSVFWGFICNDLFWLYFRILLDRAHTELDSICQSLDSDPEPEPLTSPLPSSPLRNSNASTSETNTSDLTSSSHCPSSSSPLSSSSPTSMDLSQILLNIKSCRWRHFRPRTLSHHPLGGGDLSRRGFKDFNRTVSGLTRIVSGGASSQNRTGPAPAPVNGETMLFSASVFFGIFRNIVQLNAFSLNTKWISLFCCLFMLQVKVSQTPTGPIFYSFDKLSLCKVSDSGSNFLE